MNESEPVEKQYLVIGGSSGIGLGLVHRLAQQGRVTVVSRTWSHAAELPAVEHVSADVTSDEVPVDQIPSVIDGMAYCPGSIRLRSFRGLKPGDFREDFELNLVGAVRWIQAAMKGLRAAESSSLLLFSTVAVSTGLPLHASVAASKGAIEGLTRSLAAELSPKVRVNCIAPALVQTPLAAAFFGDPAKEKAMAARYPLGRTGEVDDVASMAAFLMTEARWMTGQIVGVDGGMGSLRK